MYQHSDVVENEKSEQSHSRLRIDKYDDHSTPTHIHMSIPLVAAIVQKLLPKLHGSRKKLEPALKALWGLSMQKDHITDAITRDNVAFAKFPEAADKIQRMMQTALDNGFTSFAEA